MGLNLLLAVYLAPAGFVILKMVRARSFSLHHASVLRRLPKKITREEWLAVYGYLAIRLESRNQPPATKPGRPWRLILSGVAFATSLVLFHFILPFSIPLSFAQTEGNAYPFIQAALAGGVLASSLMLAFHRRRSWLLVGHPGADYPHLQWTLLKRKPPKEEKMST